MAFENVLKKDYENMRDSLKISFPEAYTFLTMIETQSNKGFYVRTYKNLHLYFQNSFLFYFKKISYGVIELSSIPRGRKKNQINYNVDYFFTTWMQKLEESNLKSPKDFIMKDRKKNKVNHCRITLTHSADSQRIIDTITETLEQISH